MFFNNLLLNTETTVPSTTTPTVDPTTTTEVTSTVSSNDVIQEVLNKVISWATDTGIKLLIALIILIVSFRIINFISKKISKKLSKKNADPTLSRVLVGSIKVLLKALVLICLVGYVGIETASLSAVVASLGVGISLAVQGTLSNFAGGVIIIIMRPFKLGDYITSNGESGTVEDIKLFYTHVVTPDNKVVFIPNGTLANNVIVNASVKDTRRIDLLVSVAYESNIELVKNLINKVCSSYELLLKDPAPFVVVSNYAASSIDITVRVWMKAPDYWTVNFYLLDQIKKELDANGIEIPFNQLDVNIKTNN